MKYKVLSVNLKLLTKINPVESGYIWGKSWYFNEKSLKKMENLRYIVISSLYIAILLLLRILRYNLSTKKCLTKSTLWKVFFFWGGGDKSWYFNEKSLKELKISLNTMFADVLMIIQHVETFERKNSRFHA